MREYLCNQKGSVDDIRCHLGFLNPRNKDEVSEAVELLNASIADEQQKQNRATVLKLLRQKVKSIQSKKF